jgi:hypothetical protein
VTSEHEQWLRIVIKAVNLVIEDGSDSDDPLRKAIVQDARGLRERLVNELEAGPPSGSDSPHRSP